MGRMESKFKLYQEKKNSRRFRAQDDDFPIRDVYVMKPWSKERNSFVMELKGERDETVEGDK